MISFKSFTKIFLVSDLFRSKERKMPMELKNIHTFIKVAEFENFTKASNELGYAQSTVTMQIQQLENELQANLFERNGKRIRLSSAGQEFLKYAYQISKYESMALDHFHRTEEPEGHLNIGIMETVASSEYRNLFFTFMEKYPKITLHIEVATTLKAMEDLDKGVFDLIFLLDKPIARADWKTARTFPADISFFCSSAHPLAGQKDVPLERLLQEHIVLTEKGCNYRQVFENDLAAARQNLECTMEIGHASFIINAVARQLGIGLLPLFTLKEALQRQEISLIEVKDYQIRLAIQVIYNTQRRVSLPLQVFLNELEHFYPLE